MLGDHAAIGAGGRRTRRRPARSGPNRRRGGLEEMTLRDGERSHIKIVREGRGIGGGPAAENGQSARPQAARKR